MLFPVQVDVPMSRWPWMNWLLLATMFVCYLLELSSPNVMEQFILGINGHLSPFSRSGDFFSWAGSTVHESSFSWIGHMFLHAGWLHLIGNGIFMWVFGNAICAKIGNFQYLAAWIALGLLAAIGHRLTSSAPVIGASGAINGIVGMYLVLYPLNDITMFYYAFYRFGTFTLASYWMILFWLAFDLLGVADSRNHVAHVAHIAGLACGACLALLLIKVRYLESEEYERNLVEILQKRNPSRS